MGAGVIGWVLVGLMLAGVLALFLSPVDLRMEGTRAAGQWHHRGQLTLLGAVRLGLPAGRPGGARRPGSAPRGRIRRPRPGRHISFAEVLDIVTDLAPEVPGVVGRLRRCVTIGQLEIERILVDDPAEGGWWLAAIHMLRGMGVPVRLVHLSLRPDDEAPQGLEVDYRIALRAWPGRMVGVALSLALSRPARRHLARAIARSWANRRAAHTKGEPNPCPTST